MDFYAMSNLMKDLIPSDPEADRNALLAAAGKPLGDVPVTKDYVNESAQVAPGSLPLDLDLSSLAALAGVASPKRTVVTEAPEEDAVLKSLVPGISRTKKDVGSEDSIVMVQNAIRKAMAGEVMTQQQRDAFAPYAKMLERMLEEPRLATMLDNIMKLANKQDAVNEPSQEEEPEVSAEPAPKESITAMLKRQLQDHMEKNNNG